MGKKDPRVDAYIAKSADFAKPILIHIRKTVHAACPEVEETMKWSFPHFDYKGMLCSMAAFKQHCAFGFWKGNLLAESFKQLNKIGTDAMGQLGKITSVKDLPGDKLFKDCIKKAAKLNDEGVKRPVAPRSKVKKPLVIPAYFLAAVKKNKKALATFENFSDSHKREYVEWITEAKTEETRNRRLSQAIEMMAEGKSRNWKYIKK